MGTASGEGRINRINKGAWKVSQNEQGEWYLVHECRVYSKAKVEICPYITPNGHLLVCTRYESLSTILRLESLYACCHGDLLQYMVGIINCPGAVADCTKCHAYTVNLIDSKYPEAIVATVTRDLGRRSLFKSAEERCYEAWVRQAWGWITLFRRQSHLPNSVLLAFDGGSSQSLADAFFFFFCSIYVASTQCSLRVASTSKDSTRDCPPSSASYSCRILQDTNNSGVTLPRKSKMERISLLLSTTHRQPNVSWYYRKSVWIKQCMQS